MNSPSAQTMKTHPGDWLEHFENHRKDWEEPCWASLNPSPLDRRKREALACSLAIFQVGESGGGTRLRRFVRETMDRGDTDVDGRYERAVEWFLAEENEHARLLADLVTYLGGDLKTRHWANGLFRSIRGLLGLEFNLQVLLTAELIAEAYYGLLYQRVPDSVVRLVCGRIVRDEIGHIGFHQTFFRWRQRSWLPLTTGVWIAQFQVLFVAAETLVWREHRSCLEAFGISRSIFTRRARGACRRFLDQVGNRTQHPSACDITANRRLVVGEVGD